MEGFNMRKLNRLDKLQKNVQNILVGAEHATNIFSPRGTIRRTDDIIDPQDIGKKCNKCYEIGYLVLQITVADYICEACGEWQDYILNDVYYPVGVNE